MTEQQKASLKVNELLISSDTLESDEDNSHHGGVLCPHCGHDIYSDDDDDYMLDEIWDQIADSGRRMFSDPGDYF